MLNRFKEQPASVAVRRFLVYSNERDAIQTMMNEPVAVVLGLRENGLGVVRALGRQGVPVVAVDDTVDRFYTKTRYARRVACEDFYGTGLIDRLCELGKNLGGGGVLIPTSDMTVALVSRHRRVTGGAGTANVPPEKSQA